MNTHRPAPARLFFLDWLRILAFGLLLPYHVGMYYVSWDWHVKSPQASELLEPLMMLSSPWRLGLLFFIAGAALAQQWARHPQDFVRQRSLRLLWPLVFGMFVIVPPQAFFEVVEKLGYAGSYADFMAAYLRADAGFCKTPGDCLDLPTWNHLWFLAYLWVYSLLLWGLLRVAAGPLDRWADRLATWGPLALLLAPALLLGLARQLVGRFPSSHDLTGDWYNHAQYLLLMGLGLLLARGGKTWPLLAGLRWPALLMALAGWALLLSYFSHYASSAPPEGLRLAQRMLWGGLQWWAVVAACGFAWRWLNHDGTWRRRLAPAVLCVYILHQTVIVLLTRALKPLALPALPEGLLLIALSFAICVLGYLGLRRLPGLRGAFGIVPTGRPYTGATMPA